MNSRKFLVSAALLAFLCGAATSQPPAISPPPPSLPPAPPSPPAPPREKPIEDLLEELEMLQAKKAELAKMEQNLKATINKRLEQQAERLKKLGVAPKDEKVPDRVGRIIIEGNTKTPDGKILDKLEFRPGQILQYPAIDAAKAKLEKAGFRGVSVEVLPNELDSTFKDIRVRIDESKPQPTPKLPPAINRY